MDARTTCGVGLAASGSPGTDQVDEAEDVPPLPLQTAPSTPHEHVSIPAMSIDGSEAVTATGGACRPCRDPSDFKNRFGAQQTAYPRLSNPNAFQEKFYWCTVTPIEARTPTSIGMWAFVPFYAAAMSKFALVCGCAHARRSPCSLANCMSALRNLEINIREAASPGH